MKIPRSCQAYYYGGLPVKGPRRKGSLRVEADHLLFEVPGAREGDPISLDVPLSRMDRIFVTRDNNYGSDTELLNLAFRNEGGKSLTLRFAPVAVIPRRRIFLQREWFECLSEAIRERLIEKP